jgi:hypothetical protein
MRLRGGATIAIAIAILAIAGTAQAAQRYAAPSGTGPKAECLQANPCTLKDAMEGAEANDEVIVTSGAYTVPETIFAEAEGLSIHGDFAGPMPTISAKLNFYAIQVSGAGSAISYLDLADIGEEATPLFCIGTRVERVRLTAIGISAQGLYQGPGCAVRDSVVLASGEGATALYIVGTNATGNVTRNVTAIAQGPDSVGISALNEDIASLGGIHTVDLKNSIARGEKSDLLARLGFEFPSEIFVSNSNFDRAVSEGTSKVVDLGGNQTAQPLFANAAGGDYREAAGSPTIDAGVADQLGALDLAGNSRVLGAAVDIGAYETALPPVPSVPLAGTIQSLSLAPRKFRTANVGGAIVSAKKKRKAPIGTSVTYSLSAAATVAFSVERRLPGRRVGKRCVKQTKANRTKRKCSRFKAVRGRFSHSGQAGVNSFKFSGRLNGESLKPGSYRLAGKTGSASKTVTFRIVR